jgi:hypothetical protein
MIIGHMNDDQVVSTAEAREPRIDPILSDSLESTSLELTSEEDPLK